MVQSVSPHYSPSARVNWIEAKRAFIQREERPSFEALAAEFGGTGQRMGQVANEEGWGIQRADLIEKRLAETEAGQAIAKALQEDAVLRNAARNAALTLFLRIGAIGTALESNAPKSLATQSQVANNLSFAYQNTCSGLKHMGISGIAKALGDEGREKGFDPKFLVQINNQINSAKEKVDKAEAMTVSVQAVQDTQAPTPPQG